MITPDDPRLTAFLLGELDDETQDSIAAEVEHSPELQQAVAELQQMIDLISASADESSAALGDNQHEAILSAASPSGEALSVDKNLHSTNRFAWGRLATAAILLYAIGITVYALTLPEHASKVAAQVVGEDKVDASKRLASNNESNEEKIEELIEQFNSLMDERRYSEAETIANRVHELEPDSPIADHLFHNSRLGTRLSRAEETIRQKEVEFSDALESVDQSLAAAGESDAFGDAQVTLNAELEPEATQAEDAFGLVDSEIPGNTEALSDSRVWANLRNRPLDRNRNVELAESLAYAEPLAYQGRSERDTNDDGVADANRAIRLRAIDAEVIVDRVEDLLETNDPTRLPGLLAADPDVSESFASGPMGGEDASPGNEQPRPSDRIAKIVEEAAGRGEAYDGFEREFEQERIDHPNGRELKEQQEKAKAKQTTRRKKLKTWKPATALPGAARLSVGHHDDLAMTVRDTYVRIDGFRARVMFDCYYFNDRGNQLEGQFMLRLPADASLHYFAFGPVDLQTPSTNPPVDESEIAAANASGKPNADAGKEADSLRGQRIHNLRIATKSAGADLSRRASAPNLFASATEGVFKDVKLARVVPRQKAALAYEETVRRRVDPALVEWSGPGIFQTKVFPLLPSRMHRIVIGYDVDLRRDADSWVYDLNLPEGTQTGRVELDVAATAGGKVAVTPQVAPFLSGDRAYYRFENSETNEFSVKVTQENPVFLNAETPAGNYFATRVMAALPEGHADESTDAAMFLLDTSWSQKPEAFARRLDLLQQILEENENQIRKFNVLLFDVQQRFWRENQVANNSKNRGALLDDCQALILEGATDLAAALRAAAHKINTDLKESGGDNGASPNLFLFSDGAATWGETDFDSLAAPLREIDRGEGGGALFAYRMAGFPSDNVVLNLLAETSGGAVFAVAGKEDHGRAATAHRSRPWQLTSVSGRGVSDVLIAGGARTIYADQDLTITGRGRLQGDLKIKLRRGKETTILEVSPKSQFDSNLAARVYGGVAVDRLEPLGEDSEEVTTAFAREFRVPGRVCSLVMLETEEDYARFNIDSKGDALVVQTTSVEAIAARVRALKKRERSNSKSSFVRWLEQLEGARNPFIQRGTALRLAMQLMPDDAFAIQTSPLRCDQWDRDRTPEAYLENLKADQPDYEQVMKEARRRQIESGASDALRVASTIVESRPSDPDTLRAVSFAAISWQRSDHAAPLLKRIARARPYQPQSLLLLGRCLADAGKADAAMVCYELVASGKWNDRWQGNKPIAEVALLHLLEQISAGSQTTSVPAYVAARLDQLRSRWAEEGLDLAVVMHWNTDRTDVDLHVMQPDGEECSYQNKNTKLGGAITQDITQGLGPEMYTLAAARDGKYQISAKYYSGDGNRTRAPTQTLVTVYRNLGRGEASAETQFVSLNAAGDRMPIASATIGK